MPRPRKISEAMREEIREVGRKRREFRGLPTNKELAARANCSERAVKRLLYGPNVPMREVSRGTDLDALADEIADRVLQGTFKDEPEPSS